MTERGRMFHAPVGTVSKISARASQLDVHGTTSPSRDGMCSNFFSPKPSILRSEDTDGRTFPFRY